MKRNWIKVRNGLLDPKHIEALGFCPTILYLYMLNNVDWETGVLKGWVDHEVALELGVKSWKVKEYRALLQEKKYIICTRILHGMDIAIDKWITPYSENTAKWVKSNSENTAKCTDKEVHPEVHIAGHLAKTPIQTSPASYSKTLRLKDLSTTGAKYLQNHDTEVAVMEEPKKIKDILDGISHYARPADPAATFPEDVRDVIREFIKLWNVDPPPRSSQRYAYWITGARELKLACAEIGIQVIRQLHAEWKASANPFTVCDPNSLVKSAYAVAGKLRSRHEAKAEKLCTECLGRGWVSNDSGRRTAEGRVVYERVPCPKCGKEEK